MSEGRFWIALSIALITAIGCRPDDQRTDSVDPDAARQERGRAAPPTKEKPAAPHPRREPRVG